MAKTCGLTHFKDTSTWFGMVSKVRANMRTCSKTTLVKAELRDDGTIGIHIATDCDNVRQYAKLLGDTVTIEDCTDYRNSRIFADDIRMVLSLPCLVPSAVINAASMEAGLLTTSCAKRAGSNDNEFVLDE